jgi:hypothetical protein
MVLLLLTWVPLVWNPVRGQAQGKNKATYKPQNDPSPTDGKSAINQYGSKESPMFVDILSRQKSTEEAAADQQEDAYKRKIDIGTIGIAGIVAILTLCLVVIGSRGVRAANKTLKEIERQANLMERQITDAKEANGNTLAEIQRQANLMERQAKVMEAQAKVLINSERAWVLIRPDTTHELIAGQPGLAVPYNHFRFTMFNGGKTVARLKKLQASTISFPEEQFPATPTYTPAEDFPPECCGVLAPNDDIPMKLGIYLPMDTAFIDRLKRGESRFFVFGRIEYYDFADELRVRQFCFLYASDGDRFGEDKPARWLKSGPVAYNTHT